MARSVENRQQDQFRIGYLDAQRGAGHVVFNERHEFGSSIWQKSCVKLYSGNNTPPISIDRFIHQSISVKSNLNSVSIL